MLRPAEELREPKNGRHSTIGSRMGKSAAVFTRASQVSLMSGFCYVLLPRSFPVCANSTSLEFQRSHASSRFFVSSRMFLLSFVFPFTHRIFAFICLSSTCFPFFLVPKIGAAGFEASTAPEGLELSQETKVSVHETASEESARVLICHESSAAFAWLLFCCLSCRLARS